MATIIRADRELFMKGALGKEVLLMSRDAKGTVIVNDSHKLTEDLKAVDAALEAINNAEHDKVILTVNGKDFSIIRVVDECNEEVALNQAT